MTDKLRGNFYPTAVGSLPYKDAKTACEKILKYFKDIPFWPQLVRRSFLENMYAQYSQGVPGIVVDSENKRVYVDTSKELSAEIERLYDRFLRDDVEYFSIGKEYAQGLYAFLEVLKESGVRPKFLKGQITGPVSFGLTVTDDKKRSLFHNTELKEALVKVLSMKARWQARKLKETGIECIISIDEPYLTSIGSSFISLKREDASSALGEIVAAVHKEGALAAMHCCGNTDWGFLLTTGIDILSFDAYNFYESVTLYPKEISDFLKRGGLLAWGIIPNTQDILRENYNTLVERLEKALNLFIKKGIKRADLLNSMLITPSCGLGLADEYLSDIVLENTAGFSRKMRELNGK